MLNISGQTINGELTKSFALINDSWQEIGIVKINKSDFKRMIFEKSHQVISENDSYTTVCEYDHIYDVRDDHDTVYVWLLSTQFYSYPNQKAELEKLREQVDTLTIDKLIKDGALND